jgi:4-amino-4-deoxy-L-arabinose transferase-like glycosyltransferase
MAVNLVLAALPAVIAGLLAARVLGTRLGLLVAALCALTPVALEGFAFFMLDQPLAAAALAATGLWIAFVGRPRAWVVLLFGLVAAWAVLIKGNGWLLLFVPPIHLALTGRWRVLASPWPWLAALLAALVVGPWYWLTAGIAADGFNYQPGPVYAAQALGYNFGALSDNVTPLGLALAAWGLWRGWQERADGDAWSVLAGCAALLFATLLLQSLVPVDLDARYMAPALPPLIVLAVYGARDVMARFGRQSLAVPLALLLAVPGVIHLATREPKVDLRLADVAAQARPGEAWLIDGTSGAEGALAAEMAIRDRRCSKLHDPRLQPARAFGLHGQPLRFGLYRPGRRPRPLGRTRHFRRRRRPHAEPPGLSAQRAAPTRAAGAGVAAHGRPRARRPRRHDRDLPPRRAGRPGHARHPRAGRARQGEGLVGLATPNASR